MISFLIPTRKRPANMWKFTHNMLECATLPLNIEFIWYIDSDDTESKEMFKELELESPEQTKAIIGPRITHSDTHNKCFDIAKGDIVSYIGDDVVCHTKRWDTIIEEKFANSKDKCILVYPKDGINNQSLGVHGFLHRSIVELLGYVTPDCYSGNMADTHLNEIFENLGRRVYVPEIYFEHLHYCVGKGIIDETMNEKNQRFNENRTWEIWADKLPERVEAAQKLLRYINEVSGTNLKLDTYRRIL